VPEPLREPSTGAEARIRIPSALADAGDPLDLLASPRPWRLLPTFAARSRARSRWIAIGGADRSPDGPRPVRFVFGGLETSGPDAGKVLRTGERVRSLEPLVSVDVAEVTLLPDGLTAELSGSALAALAEGTRDGISNDLYLRNPRLLEGALVRLAVDGNPHSAVNFAIVAAGLRTGEPGPGDEVLRLTTARTGVRTLESTLEEFGSADTVRLALVPRFFALGTNGVDGAFPLTTDVRIRFQAAGENGIGLPDEGTPLVEWTADPSRFNDLEPGALRFFRFEVEFDLDALARGVEAGAVPVDLDFLRVPFVF
jgi:hypothetical protein